MADLVRPALMNVSAFCQAYLVYLEFAIQKHRAHNRFIQEEGLTAAKAYFKTFLEELPHHQTILAAKEMAEMERVILEQSKKMQSEGLPQRLRR